MKAILLAMDLWNEGPVLGEPLLERSVRMLAGAGVTQVVIVSPPGRETLPEGECRGVRILRRECEPELGTAGAVRCCAGLVGDGDFWVVDGKTVWLLDLKTVAELHRKRCGTVTAAFVRAMPRDRRPAIACDRLGRVISFEECPPPERCRSMAVYAGLMRCAPAVFDRLPERGRVEELFPALMDHGRLWAARVEGYCCRVEGWQDLLKCGIELLSYGGDSRLDALRRRAGVYSAGPLPADMEFIPPCWVGEGVEIGRGSLIGPHAVLERGALVGARSLVQRSLVDGAAVGGWSTLYGAVLCPGARTGLRCVLNEGVTVGENSTLPDGTLLEEGTGTESRAAGGNEKSLYFL